MASAVVVGQGKLAAKITNILCTSSIPVAFYGMDKPFRKLVEEMVRAHTEMTIPLQFVDDLRHQQEMYARLLENLRMTDDVSRLFGEVIIDTTRTANSPLLRAVRRFVSDAPVMSIGGTATDENTVAVHLYEPFEITRIAKVCPAL
uniref:Alcohol dehydrogenase n=1 Tax=Angiostrongylus cantonensis TaxID=6313 RepID=A0A0K0DKE2_ANGCA